MKIIFKFLSLLLVVFILFSSLVFITNAASSTIIDFGGKKELKEGDKVTVNVTIKPGKKMSALRFYLQYDNSVFEYKDGDGVGEAGVIHFEESPGKNIMKCEFTFSAKKVGTGTFSVTDGVYFLQTDQVQTDEDAISFTGASASLTVKDDTLSDNAKLSSLKVSGFSLSPKFSSSKTSYTLKVPYETKKISVSAKTDDKNAKVVSVDGDKDLKVGENTVTITVEAQNGTQKKYIITVTREEEGASSEETETEDETEEETDEETEDSESLKTTIANSEYIILSKIPEKLLFKGFNIYKSNVNGYEIEAAVDENAALRIYYLKSAESDEIVPYLYDEILDQFEKLKYITIDNREYIFSKIPSDLAVPDYLYSSNVEMKDFSAECLSYSDSQMSDFHYVYCFCDGTPALYRYDALENTLQRFPDFNSFSITEEVKEGIFARFSKLSTNGKVIIIALSILTLGVITLLVMIIIHLFKKSLNNDGEIIMSDSFDDFDEVEIEDESNVLK